MAVANCKYCGYKVSTAALTCHKCGGFQPSTNAGKNLLLFIIAVPAVLVFIVMCSYA